MIRYGRARFRTHPPGSLASRRWTRRCWPNGVTISRDVRPSSPASSPPHRSHRACAGVLGRDRVGQGQAPAHSPPRSSGSRWHRQRARAGAHLPSAGGRQDDHRLLPRALPPREPRAGEAARRRSEEDEEREGGGARGRARLRRRPRSRSRSGGRRGARGAHHRRSPPRSGAAQGALRRSARRRRRDLDHLRRVPAGAGAARSGDRGRPPRRDGPDARPVDRHRRLHAGPRR